MIFLVQCRRYIDLICMINISRTFYINFYPKLVKPFVFWMLNNETKLYEKNYMEHSLKIKILKQCLFLTVFKLFKILDTILAANN